MARFPAFTPPPVTFPFLQSGGAQHILKNPPISRAKNCHLTRFSVESSPNAQETPFFPGMKNEHSIKPNATNHYEKESSHAKSHFSVVGRNLLPGRSVGKPGRLPHLEHLVAVPKRTKTRSVID